jgi:hypothetical protein
MKYKVGDILLYRYILPGNAPEEKYKSLIMIISYRTIDHTIVYQVYWFDHHFATHSKEIVENDENFKLIYEV